MSHYVMPLACGNTRLCVTDISYVPNFSSARLTIGGGGASIRSFNRDTGIVEIATLSSNYYFTLYIFVDHHKVVKKEIDALSEDTDGDNDESQASM